MFVWTKLYVWKCRAGAGAVVTHGLLQAVLALVLILSPSVLRAEGRWALVVGVAQYQSASIPGLENTLNDARTMSAALNNMGFRVYLVENATRADVSATIAQIGVDVPDADLGFFFFAGHGVQIGGTNYLLTAEIDPAQPDFLTKQGLTINSVLSDLTAIRPQKLVVVLDSCRNSPFGVDQAYGTGMALLDAPENALIAYSTAPGAVALDGTNGNSPYTAALASALDGPQQDIRDVLRYVRAKVRWRRAARKPRGSLTTRAPKLSSSRAIRCRWTPILRRVWTVTSRCCRRHGKPSPPAPIRAISNCSRNFTPKISWPRWPCARSPFCGRTTARSCRRWIWVCPTRTRMCQGGWGR